MAGAIDLTNGLVTNYITADKDRRYIVIHNILNPSQNAVLGSSDHNEAYIRMVSVCKQAYITILISDLYVQIRV
jgi:hypothetical protein